MFRYIGLIVCNLLLLTACASQQQHVMLGQQSFESGRYAQALGQLMPAAEKGNAEAQYAIGYMFYYGLGTQQNAAAGMAWIDRAAAAQYAPAINALKMMRQH